MNWEQLKMEGKRLEGVRKAFAESNPEEYKIICLLEEFESQLGSMSPHGPLCGVNRDSSEIIKAARLWLHNKRREYPDLPKSIVVWG